MSRWWSESVAAIGDHIPLWLLAVLVLLAATVLALGWYHYPRWLPGRWRRPTTRTGRKGGPDHGDEDADAGDDDPEEDDPQDGDAETALPDLPAQEFRSRADRFATQGRYAEAVRERLRAIVRELVDSGAIVNSPGWTIMELSVAATAARPRIRQPLAAATGIFSDIWYGLRPAQARDDELMRAHEDAVHRSIGADPAGNGADV